jgi:mannose-1-phosphate guanylyltransferase/mannose-6-phosphate isomerase
MRYAIILAGGSGTRFWPASRKRLPKQFLKIVHAQTLLEETLRRVRKVIPPENTFIVTNRLYFGRTKSHLMKFSLPKANIILEPSAKNTLPAISLCAQLISRKDPQAKLIILPADHYIRGEAQFKSALVKAQRAAGQGIICLVGVRPDKPCPGYGYIAARKSAAKGVFRVTAFIEKPDLAKARRIYKRRGVYWNAGIFCFDAAFLLAELKRWQPALYRQISRIGQTGDINRIWPRIKPVSIDYGLLEKSGKLAMVEAEFYWRDVGSWDSLGEILPKDKSGNVKAGSAVDLGSRNIFVYSHTPKRLIATVGLNDLIIVDTTDALLVCSRGKSEKIKDLVKIMEKKREPCV